MVTILSACYLVIIIIIKKVGCAGLRETDIHPFCPNTPAENTNLETERREMEK